MSEPVIADFVAKFNSDRLARAEPIAGRVLLSEKRLVLAVKDSDKLTIPLHTIYDIGVGQVPDELDGFFESTVTLVFERQNRRFVAAIEGDDEKIDKFSTLLFKAVLNGTSVTIKHPARVGGRVLETEFQPAKVFVQPKQVEFKTAEEDLSIYLAHVRHIQRMNRDIAGQPRPVLEIQHMPEGRAITTMAATDNPRKMGLLGRYCRLEYADIVTELSSLEFSKDEKQALVALYSGTGSDGISLPAILNLEHAEVTILLNRLKNDGLIIDTESGVELTPKGHLAVNQHLEDINL